MRHAPTPWSVGEIRYHGQTVEIDTKSRDPDLGHRNWTAMIECCGSNENPDIGIQKAMANARFIVKAVNYHDRLVEALMLSSELNIDGTDDAACKYMLIVIQKKARALLKDLEQTHD